ncbi:endonuclease [Candidatus Poribacteria bacterium]|nr:endonuclease [Candidatus Poribacteria bacterium]
MNHRFGTVFGFRISPVTGKRRLPIRAAIFLVLSSAAFAQYDPPAGYYDPATGLTGSPLKAALHEIIDDHRRFPYSASSTDVLDIIHSADEDPANSSNILDIYKNASYPKGTSHSIWNREHSWPKSHGFPDDGNCNYPYTDVHHLWASDASYNSSRSNKPYDWCVTGCVEKPVNGSSSSNWSGSGVWETWAGRQGDVARSMFYMDTRYEGGVHGVTGCAEPDLVLTDNLSMVTSHVSGSNFSPAYMGKLSTLLEWHVADPPDAKERRRNHVVYGYQGNRNPYIDHPEWVAAVFLAQPPADNDTVAVSSVVRSSPVGYTGANLVMLCLVLQANTNEWDAAGFTVSQLGSITDGQITAIHVHRDANSNGVLDAGEPQIGTGTLGGGSAPIGLAPAPRATAGAPVQLLISAAVSPGAQPGSTVQLRVDANSLRHSATGGHDTDPSFPALQSGSTSLLASAGVTDWGRYQ